MHESLEREHACGTVAVPQLGQRAHCEPDVLEHKARTEHDGTEFVFGPRADHPFTPTIIRKRALTAWAQANGKRREEELPELVPIGLHECRHTCVSMLDDASRRGRFCGPGAGQCGPAKSGFVRSRAATERRPRSASIALAMPHSALRGQQGRQDSNLQPPVLETGALPVELRPSVCGWIVDGASGHRPGVSEHRPEEPAEDEREDELLEEQEGKGYGEDEGEREQALNEFLDEEG
jgi:hypothetical protein